MLNLRTEFSGEGTKQLLSSGKVKQSFFLLLIVAAAFFNSVVSFAQCTDPAWNTSIAYTNGSKVSYSGHTYTAGWWTQGEQPDTHTGSGQPWVDNGTCVASAPIINIVTPAENQVYYQYPSDGQQITVTVTTSPAVVDSVKYVIVQTVCDGPGCAQITRLTSKTAPYSVNYNPLYTGWAQVSAVAFKNGIGSVSVQHTFYVNALPELTITSPLNNAVYPRSTTSIPVSVTVNNNQVNIDSVVYNVFDTRTTGMSGATTTRKFVVTAAPYGFNLPVIASNTFTKIFALAYGAGGKVSKTQLSLITYNDLPVLTITSPLPVNGINPTYLVGGSITITANATDPDGVISRVVFTQGTNPAETIVSSPPYTATFTNLPAPTPDGSYWFTVTAYDNSGGSSSAFVIVYKNRVPIVTITSPANNATFATGSNIAINTILFDPDFLSGKVEFFNGTTKLGETTSAPFNFTINNAAAGAYTITAKVTDDKGQTGVTSVLNITVGTTCTAALWNTATAYSGGAIVQYNGIKYQANWWTQGNQPDINSGASGSGQPWLNLGTCTSRKELSVSDVQLNAYPNPFVDELTVNGKVNGATAVVTISDLNGRTLQSKNLTADNGNVSTTFSTSSFQNGVYVIQILSGDEVSTFRVIK